VQYSSIKNAQWIEDGVDFVVEVAVGVTVVVGVVEEEGTRETDRVGAKLRVIGSPEKLS